MIKSTKPKAPWTRMRNAKLKGPGGKIVKGMVVNLVWGTGSIRRSIKPKRKAAWTVAFPEQVDDRVAEATKAEQRQYRVEAKEFVRRLVAVGARCPVVAAVPELRNGHRYGHPISDKLNEVHHTHGRRGRLLNYQPWWMAVSKQGHRWIHQHPIEARALGFLCEAGKWNCPPPS